MIKQKIVVIGPESTGKSTLSEALAKEYQTVWVPEYARTYLETIARPYNEADLTEIAEGQLRQEDSLTLKASNLVICDTNLYVIKVWGEHKYGRCNSAILEHIATRKYDLYLLTDIDFPWVPDEQREHPDPVMRAYFYHIYKDIVMQSGVPWASISGNPEERLEKAKQAIAQLL